MDSFLQQTDYSIQGLETDEETQNYLQDLLKERLAEPIDYDMGTEDFQRAEAAREQTIAADLMTALKAKGYYDAKIEYVNNDEKQLSGSYQIEKGTAYAISSITILPKKMAGKFNDKYVKPGDILKAEQVLLAQKAWSDALQKDTCYFSLKVTHAVTLDEEEKSAALEYTADIGKKATFGSPVFVGQESVENEYLQKLVPWKEGDCFRRDKIESLKTKILETGLFVRADSELPEAPDDNGRVDVTLNLKERVHRTLKAGASYYTDEGPGVLFGWEHRNILGQGEKLETELKLGSINQSFDMDLTKPFFLRNDQSLAFNTAIRRQDTDAYEELALDVGASIERQINKRLSARAGTQFSFSEITDEDDKETYGLLSFPVSTVYDSRDNTLDPHKGWYLTGATEPFFDVLGNSDPFVKLDLGARTYLGVSEKPDVVLAMRGNVGSIVGGSTENIPATERYYAGGGGSVRGFGYQEVGPFEDGDPTGGRSVVTGSTELRLKLTDTLGAVAFVDGGSVSESSSPDLDNFSVGAGLGFRYFTSFGPLRFDVAVPLNQKDDLDQNYQFYISIGQAF